METSRAAWSHCYVELPLGPCQDKRCCLPPASYIQKWQGDTRVMLKYSLCVLFFSALAFTLQNVCLTCWHVLLGQVRRPASEGYPSIGIDAGPPKQRCASLSLWGTKEHFLWPRSGQQDSYQELRWNTCSGQITEENPWPGPDWHNHRYHSSYNVLFFALPHYLRHVVPCKVLCTLDWILELQPGSKDCSCFIVLKECLFRVLIFQAPYGTSRPTTRWRWRLWTMLCTL